MSKAIPHVVDELFNEAFPQEQELASKNPKSSSRWFLFFRELLIVIIAGVGGSNYAIPTQKAVEHNSTLTDLVFLAQIGACLPAALILYNATIIFFDWVNKETPPDALAEYFPKGNKRAQTLSYTAIVIGSAICSLPLAGTYVAYTDDQLYVVIILGSTIEIANALMHFLPLKLMLAEPIYRFPVLPFEWAIKRLIKSFEAPLTPFEVCQKRQEGLTGMALNELGQRIRSFGTESMNQSYTFRMCSPEMHLSDPISQARQGNGLRPLITEGENQMEEEMSLHSRFLKNVILREIVFWIGGAWLITCAVPFSLTTFNLINDQIGNPYEAWCIAGLPAYAFAVLVVFFGGNMVVDLFVTFLKLIEGKNVLPRSAQLYPLAFYLFQSVAIFCSLFLYSPTLTLLRDNIPREEVGVLYDLLTVGGLSSVTYLGIDCVITFSSQCLEKYALNFGSPEKSALVRFWKASELVAAWLQHLDPLVATELILQTSTADQMIYFGKVFSVEIQEAGQPQQKPRDSMAVNQNEEEIPFLEINA